MRAYQIRLDAETDEPDRDRTTLEGLAAWAYHTEQREKRDHAE